MLTREDHVLIEKYFRHALSEKEQAVFDNRLQDIDFQDAFDQTSSVIEGIAAEGRSALRTTLSSWDREKQNVRSTPHFRQSVLKWASAAAAIVVLIIVIIFGMPQSQEEIYAEFLQPYPNVISPLQKGSGMSGEVYDRAFQIYESGRYQEAEASFEKLSKKDPAVQFYYALTLLMEGQYSRARAGLNRIAGDPSHRFHQPAQWYLALIDLRFNYQKRAEDQLRTIRETAGHPYQGRAGVLLERIVD